MNKEVIDLFDQYSYLNDDYIDKILAQDSVFPANSYDAQAFLDLTTSIFEIPYKTLLSASIDFLQLKASPSVNS